MTHPDLTLHKAAYSGDFTGLWRTLDSPTTKQRKIAEAVDKFNAENPSFAGEHECMGALCPCAELGQILDEIDPIPAAVPRKPKPGVTP